MLILKMQIKIKMVFLILMNLKFIVNYKIKRKIKVWAMGRIRMKMDNKRMIHQKIKKSGIMF